MHADVALIGGTGIGERLEALGGHLIHIPTPLGLCRGRVFQRGSVQVFAARRHGSGDRKPPHHVNYNAIAYGCKLLGVRACISTAAVGSLLEDVGPGSVAVCDDFIDLSGRNLTCFELRATHTAVHDALTPAVCAALGKAVASIEGTPSKLVTYVGMNGPRYETNAEIRAIRTLGGDVVGMTMTTEAIAMKELGVDYGCIAIVSNFAAGMEGAILDHIDVKSVVQEKGPKVVEAMLNAAVELAT